MVGWAVDVLDGHAAIHGNSHSQKPFDRLLTMGYNIAARLNRIWQSALTQARTKSDQSWTKGWGTWIHFESGTPLRRFDRFEGISDLKLGGVESTSLQHVTPKIHEQLGAYV